MTWRFLHHPQSPQYARYILKSHPEIKSFADSEDRVRAWVTMWHQEHEAWLRQFLIKQEALIMNEGGRAFTLLGTFMDFNWQPDTTYTANLSLLPFSPFENNEFFYSVINELLDRKSAGRSVLLVAMHEVSHFIFFRYLGQATKRFGWTLGQDAIYFLKEALTTAMLNSSEFRELFGTEPHQGNPELQNIFINQSPEPLLLVLWMEARLKEMQDTGDSFSELIMRMLKSFHAVESEFTNRMKLWHTHGSDIQKHTDLLAEYRKHITLKV